MRPEDKSADDNQMGARPIGTTGSPVGLTAGVSMTPEDKSGLQLTPSEGTPPNSKGYTAPYNAQAVPINKSRGTGVQINNGALTAAGGNPAGPGPAFDDDGSGPTGAKASNITSMGYGSVASEMSKVTSVSGDKVAGMNFGPSIGRFDNPPAVITRTGTLDSVEDALSAIEDRWPGTDTEHLRCQQLNGTDTGKDRLWR